MPSNAVTRFISKTMTSWHRRSGDKFQGMDLLYLTTVGAKGGEKRQSTVTRVLRRKWRLADRGVGGRRGQEPGLVSQHRGASRSGVGRVRRHAATGDWRMIWGDVSFLG
jgi:hypothetical protein